MHLELETACIAAKNSHLLCWRIFVRQLGLNLMIANDIYLLLIEYNGIYPLFMLTVFKPLDCIQIR